MVSGFLGGAYLVEVNVELDGDRNKILKDGLVGELLKKSLDEEVDVVVGNDDITVGTSFAIRKTYGGIWFPYEVVKLALPFNERRTVEDWGGTVGYVTWLSKDYKVIKTLLNKRKKLDVDDQRKKLNLDK